MWPDILASRYRLGGRSPGHALDCAGTVLEIARRIGLCIEDPWAQLCADWAAGRVEMSSALPHCWRRTEQGATMAHGDIALFYEQAPAHPWVAIVAYGHVWSADARVGSPYGRRATLWTRQPDELWRHDPSLHPQGHPRH
jgi:hypothetical protein